MCHCGCSCQDTGNYCSYAYDDCNDCIADKKEWYAEWRAEFEAEFEKRKSAAAEMTIDEIIKQLNDEIRITELSLQISCHCGCSCEETGDYCTYSWGDCKECEKFQDNNRKELEALKEAKDYMISESS